MQPTIKTPIAASRLNITYAALCGLLQRGTLRRPGRDSSGHLAWTERDLEEARRVLAARKRGRAAV